MGEFRNPTSKNAARATARILALLAASPASAYVGGSPTGFAGAPGEGTCTACHNSYPLDSGPGSVELLEAPVSYSPGQSYTFWVSTEDPGMSVWGFQLTALDAFGARAGELIPGAPDSVQVLSTGSRDYIEQRTLGAARGVEDGPLSWRVIWTAPEAPGAGAVSFHFTALSGNNDYIAWGDYTYSGDWTVAEGGPVLDLSLEGVPASVDRGANLEFTGIIANQGESVAHFDEADLDASGPIPPTNVPLYDGPPRLAVDPGGSLSSPVSVPVPAGAPTGSYLVEVSIADQGVRLDAESFTIEVTDPGAARRARED